MFSLARVVYFIPRAFRARGATAPLEIYQFVRG